VRAENSLDKDPRIVRVGRKRRRAAEWFGEDWVAAPNRGSESGHLEVEREFDLGLITDETRRSYKRRFIVAWHESIPSSLPLDPIEPLLDVRRAAHLLGISVKTLRDWIHARRIEYVKVGARVMIRPETIRQFVTSNTRRAAIG
jgi:excisionase family DNA binding protein